MSAVDKEKIFVELRQYHTEEFADKLSTKAMDSLRQEFSVLEDNIVTMLLNLVNGKAEFVDFAEELNEFKNKAKVTKGTEPTEAADRNFFVAKIDSLNHILDMARAAVFRLRIPRGTKA